MRERLRLKELVVVEGRYDAAALAGVVDGLILTTDGFSIFSDDEKKALLRHLGAQRGLILLTDSDAAGFRIRHYLEKIAGNCEIKHAYIPAVAGKESRKAQPSKEGTLGVEGMRPEVLREALLRAGAGELPPRRAGEALSYTDLYELGISGGAGSARRRHLLLQRTGLPPRLSKRALRQVLGSLYTREELQAMLDEKPVLFWDFHGTLTLPDVTWFEAAMEAAAEEVPEKPLSQEVLERHFAGRCLPWWSVPSRDTRHLTGSGAWWAHCEKEFVPMLQACGFSEAEARRIAPKMREKVLQPGRYRLYPDALATLETLKQRGYRHYLLSNNYPELEELAGALGLAPLLEGVVVSAKAGYDKPRREIFDMARQTAGDPALCWMMGDNAEDDIGGANAAGFVSVWVHPKPGATAPATHCLQNLADILPLLP